MDDRDQRHLRQCVALLLLNILMTAGGLAGAVMLGRHVVVSGSSYEQRMPQIPDWPAHSHDGPRA